MQVGDLVKHRRPSLGWTPTGVGVVIKNIAKDGVPTAWWSILWRAGKIEIESERNLKVINESR